MKTIRISDLYAADLYVKELSVITQTPEWTTIGSLEPSGHPRVLNGFLLIRSGSCRYDWLSGGADLAAGDLIYLPCGAKRVVIVGENGISFYRISFRLFDVNDGEEIVFSEEPYVAARCSGEHIFELCERLTKSTSTKRDTLQSLSLLYELLDAINRKEEKRSATRITPAVEYIERHYAENFDVSLLAELCYMSVPHFFRLFKKEIGRTPIEHRNVLRVNRAKILLLDDEHRIGEIASALGFESIYYFSRIFKSIVGISPSQFKTNNKNPL